MTNYTLEQQRGEKGFGSDVVRGITYRSSIGDPLHRASLDPSNAERGRRSFQGRMASWILLNELRYSRRSTSPSKS